MSLGCSVLTGPGLCPVSGLLEVEAAVCKLLSTVFLWKKEEMPGLAEPFLELEERLKKETGQLVSVSNWQSAAEVL